MATKKANNTNKKNTKKEKVEIEEKTTQKKIEKNPVKNTMTDRTRHTIIGIVCVIVIGLIGFLIYHNYSESNKNSEIMKKFNNVFNSEERHLIFFARTSCGYCQLEKPILKQIVDDYKLDYLDIDTDNLTTAEVNKIVKELKLSGATPALVIVEKGKVVKTNEGYLDGRDFVEFLKENKVLSKDATYKPEENLQDVSFEDFKKLVKENKYQAVLIDTIACSECITVRSIVSGIAKDNKIKIKYINPNQFNSEEDVNLFIRMFKDLKYDNKEYKESEQISVPLLIIVKNNKIEDYLVNNTEKDDYTKLLKKYKIIK